MELYSEKPEAEKKEKSGEEAKKEEPKNLLAKAK
jgi:hypothetical protein